MQTTVRRPRSQRRLTLRRARQGALRRPRCVLMQPGIADHAVGAEVDKLVETKGLNEWDRECVHFLSSKLTQPGSSSATSVDQI